MRKALVGLLGVCLLALLVGSVSARDIDRSGLRFMQALTEEQDPALIDQGARSLMTSAAADTYCIIWFDFEPNAWQGFVAVDNTAQIDYFWHVDDFAGLGGGTFGRLIPIEGGKSMWCGTRPGTDDYMCSWVSAPGYGNGWSQMLISDPISFQGVLTWSYRGVFDSEDGYDFTNIQYDAGEGNWVTIERWDGVHDTLAVHQLLLSQAATKLRFHFTSDGAWSDQDGLHPTDGAAIVDEITISDATGVLNYENFESAAVGDKVVGIWRADVEEAFGSFGGLANNLLDKDPCGSNFGTQVVFFDGSPYQSADYPGLFNTPFCTGPGGTEAPCQDAALVSPVIDMTKYSTGFNEVQDADIPTADLPLLAGAVYRFTVYRDLPLANLVFYTWSVRNIDAQGCPGQWRDRNFVYYGGDQDYIFGGFDVSDLVGNDPIQVRIGVVDMCQYWYLQYGDCAAHTPSPWLDNVRVYRFRSPSPNWTFRDLDLFQDTFPTEELNIESYCRADAANDINRTNIRIIPGDSAVVDCAAPLAGGLRLDNIGGEDLPAVYAHFRARYVGPTGKPDLAGAVLQGTYGTYVSDDGEWTIMHCPPARTASGVIVADRYMIDLNDSLFTRGYEIEYYFKGFDALGQSSTLPRTAQVQGGNMFSFSTLPTLNSNTLYVDDFEGRGTFVGTVQTYFDPAFAAVATDVPDRYDVNAPSSAVSNGVGAYAHPEHIKQAYEKIIFDSGNLSSVTLSEGVSDKSNEAALFVEWLRNSDHKVGLWVLGNDVAFDLSRAAAPAVAQDLMENICGVAFSNRSYYNLTGGRVAGGVITPLITGVSGSPFAGIQYYAYGGCPIIKAFDVLEKVDGVGEYCLQYPDFGGNPYYAGVYTSAVNNFAQPMRTVWMGHSFMYVRNAGPGVPATNQLVKAVWDFFDNDTQVDITDATPEAKVYSLAQNFPNPFNPATRISFALPVKGHVSLRVYNVAGQLVKTLTDGVWEAGSHELTWDGTNNLGASVASGVYFYKLTAGGDYENMKKMVLLR